jgi:hypothetical protein
LLFAALLALSLAVVAVAAGSTPSTDARLSKDCTAPLPATPTEECGGYISNYALVTGDHSYDAQDPTLSECSVAHGRQNEPSVAVDPRNTSLLLGSSNDYCGVYNTTDNSGNPVPAGPIWLGYYRSQASGAAGTWVSSLVPGYPNDPTPYAALSGARTASAGDPVIAWDNNGRAFFGSESSDDPAGTPKTFGDVFVARFVNPNGPTGAPARDGLKYDGTTVVAKGSSAPNLLGKFNDKTAIEVDRTGGPCDGNVYFSWSRFTGNGVNGIYFSRSTNHGVTFSQPIRLSTGSQLKDLQFPDISVTGNGNVYETFRSFSSHGQSTDAIYIAKSTDCGQTFGPATQVTTFVRSDAADVRDPQPMSLPQSQVDDPFFSESGDAQSSTARDCGDFSDHCKSGFTFFRRDTQVRSTADQTDAAHQWIYMVYDATKPGTVEDSTTTYSSAGDGKVGQAAIFYLRYDGATGAKTAPAVISDEATGHRVFPDISADGGVLHALWWDSHNDPCYSVQHPIGNCGPENAPTYSDRQTVPSLDVYASTAGPTGNWSPAVRVTDVTSNPNYEQFDNRAVPFAGDYLWVTSKGNFSYGAWTDWRNTVAGIDPREATGDADAGNADVHQCRVQLTSTDKKGNTTTSWSGDRCPHAGGLDQDIYGDTTP